ncbi:MAG: hypothetical protein JNL11_02755 [Bdellovibrionaceae bacterium]|nr:hypothetical protein [Pseudobdellovibrionaceae bacterium]
MKKITLLCSLVFLSTSFAQSIQSLTTIAEKSAWKQTGRADETQKLCHQFSRTFPARIQCKSYGKTPEGRRLWYIHIQDAKPIPQAPIVWIQAGIHAGEIDGKDAVFALMKNVFVQKTIPDLFKGLNVIFVPIVNLDGHERFGKWNRPNQVGPEEMGWRVTAQNYNMNRDFAKSDSLEMQNLNKLWNQYTPVISLDLHVTDGAHFQPEIGIITTPTENSGSSALHKAGTEYENMLMEKMKLRGRMALPFYPSFEEDDRPLSGFSRGVSPPRFANGYWFVRNRIGVLVESHSWKDYPTRVKTHYDTVASTLEIAQQKGAAWTIVAQELDKQNLAGKKIDVSFKKTGQFSTIEFPGYKFSITRSKISNSDVIRYFLDKPEIWKVPFYEALTPALSVIAPTHGYIIPASEIETVRRTLDVHGIRYHLLKTSVPEKLGVFRASKVELSKVSFEGRQTATIEGAWSDEKVELAKGSLFVPINQPNARIAVHLLEPLAPDSFVFWGCFNRFFEMKEYMEDYVAEDVATEMLKDKKISVEFEAKLKDESFAKDPAKRFRFFYQKHSSWDDRYSRYPILKW